MSENDVKAAEAREMLEYRRKLHELLATDSPALFSNYSRAHADCIVATFLRYAQHTVSILSGDFAALLRNSPEVLNALEDALARGITVRVVTLAGGRAEVDAALPSHGLPNFNCRVGRVAPGAMAQHYMVVDGKRYRLEEAHGPVAPSSVRAECCCNGPGKASYLRAAFDQVWAKLGNAVA